MAGGKIEISMKDVPEVIAALQEAQYSVEHATQRIDDLRAFVRDWLVREHPDPGSRLACPAELCERAVALLGYAEARACQ